MENINELTAIDPETGLLNVIIETPKGSRNKYGYDEKYKIYRLKGVLPAGANFPYDFGFLPSTLGEDGDPLDILILMEESAFPGCLISCRLIGVIEAEQTEEGKTVRNDRLIGVSANSKIHEEITSLKSISQQLLSEIDHFFYSYNKIRGKKFKVLGHYGPKKAVKLIEEGAQLFRKKKN